MTYHDVEQRSDAWYALRLGRFTASRAPDAMATNRDGKPAASRRNLLVQLMLERLTRRSHERTFRSQAMQDGIDREADALALYQAIAGVLVTPIGFVAHDTILAGCSPDGLIGDAGLVSVKCPIPATHLEYLRSGVVPADYRLQITHECWITGRRWADFFSYQPDFVDLGLEAKRVRVDVTDAEVESYARRALAFLEAVDLEVLAVRTMADHVAQLRAAVA